MKDFYLDLHEIYQYPLEELESCLNEVEDVYQESCTQAIEKTSEGDVYPVYMNDGDPKVKTLIENLRKVIEDYKKSFLPFEQEIENCKKFHDSFDEPLSY